MTACMSTWTGWRSSCRSLFFESRRHLRQDQREAGNDGGKLLDLAQQEKYLKQRIADLKREIKAELDLI